MKLLKKMILKNIPLDTISECTDLSIEKIKSLKEELEIK